MKETKPYRLLFQIPEKKSKIPWREGVETTSLIPWFHITWYLVLDSLVQTWKSEGSGKHINTTYPEEWSWVLPTSVSLFKPYAKWQLYQQGEDRELPWGKWSLPLMGLPFGHPSEAVQSLGGVKALTWSRVCEDGLWTKHHTLPGWLAKNYYRSIYHSH